MLKTTIIEGKTEHGTRELMTPMNDLLDGNDAVVSSGDFLITENSPVGMSVLVAAGKIYSYISANDTYYRHEDDSNGSLTIDPNTSGSTRIDLICIKTDLTVSPDSEGAGVASRIVVKGTPGAGIPATPANHTRLGYVTVANGASSITTANITNTIPTITLNTSLLDLAPSPPQGYMQNGEIHVSVSSGNITVALKTLAGTNPSISDPVYIRIGDAVRSVTSALSVTKNAGTNWFNAGSSELATKEIDYFAYLGYNATDGVTIGFARIPHANKYSDFSTTSTNDKYAAISTITNASANDYYENIARFAATLSAGAGYTWTVPTFTASNLIQRPIFESRWLDYIPTHGGLSSMTTSSPSISAAKYRITAGRAEIQLKYTVITGGSPSQGLLVSMPISRLSTNADMAIGSGHLGDGTSWTAVIAFNGFSTNQAVIYKYNVSNYVLITVTIFGISGFYEI